MTEIVLFVGLLLGNMTVTSYRSVPSQTDSSPNYTSIGDRTHKGGCAVSRDLLHRWGGPLNYGDYLFVEGMGIYQINDVMGETVYDKTTHKRYKLKKHIDLWVASKEEESRIGLKHKAIYLMNRRIP